MNEINVVSVPTVVSICKTIVAYLALLDLGVTSPNPVVESVVIVK